AVEREPCNPPLIPCSSVTGMCLAAAMRNPSTPRRIRPLRYAVSLPRTYEDSVARSDRSTSSQFWTSQRTPQSTMSTLPLRPQWWKSSWPDGAAGYPYCEQLQQAVPATVDPPHAQTET